MKRKSAYLACLIAMLAFTLAEELTIRPALFRHHAAPWLAGSLPNALAPLVLAFAYAWIKGSDGIGRSIAAFVLGLTVYECVQPFMPGRTFDLKDIAASIVGGVVAWLLIAAIDACIPVAPSAADVPAAPNA